MTGADLAGAKIGKKIIDMPLLAEDVVRFMGEKIAAVAAESEAIAEAALDLIEVEYEELPVVIDPLEALQPRRRCFIPMSRITKGCCTRSTRRATSSSV